MSIGKDASPADYWESRWLAMRDDHSKACTLVADMHAAAVGEVRGPVLGIVEDVAALRQDALRYRFLRDKAWTDDHDGGWSGSWRLPGLTAWNDSPAKEYRVKRRTFDEAVDAARTIG